MNGEIPGIYISVVAPLYNEEEVVMELHREVESVLSKLEKPYEIVLVNDGSSDSTQLKLRELQEKHRNVVVVELARNFGQTAALAAGIDESIGEVIVTMDGDLQHDPREIPRFLQKLDEGYDVVSGWRKVRTDNFILRRIPSWCANALMRHLSGVSLQDFGSAYKAYRAEAIKKIQLFGELHRFVPILAHRYGARITEIPIAVHPRKVGESKYGIGRTFGVLQDIVFLEFYLNYVTKPIRAFGRLFLMFFGAGASISFALLVLWFVGVIPSLFDRGGLLLFSVFLMIVGVQFFVAGILAELLSRIHFQTRGDKIYAIRNILRT